MKILLVLTLFFITSSFADNTQAFMKMCENPTSSQKVTLEAVAKASLVPVDKNMCKTLRYQFIYKSFRRISAKNSNIEDLSPLVFFSNLQSLYLSDNKINDISLLKKLPKLKELKIDGNPIRDLSPLKDLKHLKLLNIYDTNVTDLSPLNNLKSLKSLAYGNHSVDTLDIAQIKDLKSLEYLGLLNLKIKNFCLINNFTTLMRFSPPSYTTSKDLQCLTELTNLEKLRLDNTAVTGIEFVLNFPKLKRLFLSNTQVKDISVLAKVHTLTNLSIKNTKVRDASVLAGRQGLIFLARDTPLKMCSPKNTEDVENGKSCFEKDGTLKPLWKRWLGI